MDNKKDTLDDFFGAVRSSLNSHASRKGYCNSDGVDGNNQFLSFKLFLGIGTGHHIGEILTKVVEYTKSPRRVLLEKVCGWAYLEWKNCKD